MGNRRARGQTIHSEDLPLVHLPFTNIKSVIVPMDYTLYITETQNGPIPSSPLLSHKLFYFPHSHERPDSYVTYLHRIAIGLFVNYKGETLQSPGETFNLYSGPKTNVDLDK